MLIPFFATIRNQKLGSVSLTCLTPAIEFSDRQSAHEPNFKPVVLRHFIPRRIIADDMAARVNER